MPKKPRVGHVVRTQEELIVEFTRKAFPLIPSSGHRSHLQSHLRKMLSDGIIGYLLQRDMKLSIGAIAAIIGRPVEETVEAIERASRIEKNDSDLYKKVLQVRDNVYETFDRENSPAKRVVKKVVPRPDAGVYKILEQVGKMLGVDAVEVQKGNRLRLSIDARAITMAIDRSRNPQKRPAHIGKYFGVGGGQVLYSLRRISALAEQGCVDAAPNSLAERVLLVCTGLGIPLESLILPPGYARIKNGPP